MSLKPTYLPLAISVAVKAMREFCQQWYSGLQPCLSLEISADGEIRVCSRVIAGDVATTQPRDAHHGHVDTGQVQKRRRGPSYHRRMKRRRDARKAAAASKIADKAIQVVSGLPLTETEYSPPQVQTFPIPLDELCPDKDYLLPTQDQHLPPQHQLVDTIPQLDGHEPLQHEGLDDSWINPDPYTGAWVCRCCEFAHTFPTEDDLRLHHDQLIFEYDECNICYPWHVWS